MSEIVCPDCGTKGQWTEPRDFNMMLKTYLGPIETEEGLHYLRPGDRAGHLRQLRQRGDHSAQEAAVRHRPDRQELPQRDHPGQLHLPHPRVRADGDGVLRRAVHRAANGTSTGSTPGCSGTSTSASTATTCGSTSIPRRSCRTTRDRTVDIEYKFGFQGNPWGELEGVANRTDFDLSTHSKHSGVDLSFYDQATDTRYVPYVIEPAAGLTRSFMAFLVDAYTEDEAPNAKGGVDKRTVLRLDPRLAPVKAAVLPLSRQRGPVAQGARPRRRAAQVLERRIRRRRRDRPALPPPGRDRHAVLRDAGLRLARRPGRHDPRTRRDDAGAGRARRGVRTTWRCGSRACLRQLSPVVGSAVPLSRRFATQKRPPPPP